MTAAIFDHVERGKLLGVNEPPQRDIVDARDGITDTFTPRQDDEMTTYPLSEPATIYAEAEGGKASSGSDEVLSRGSLSDCADLLQTWSPEKRASVRIEVDDMEIRYGPDEIEELLTFLREESSGLSDKDITEIADRDGA